MLRTFCLSLCLLLLMGCQSRQASNAYFETGSGWISFPLASEEGWKPAPSRQGRSWRSEKTGSLDVYTLALKSPALVMVVENLEEVKKNIPSNPKQASKQLGRVLSLMSQWYQPRFKPSLENLARAQELLKAGKNNYPEVRTLLDKVGAELQQEMDNRDLPTLLAARFASPDFLRARHSAFVPVPLSDGSRAQIGVLGDQVGFIHGLYFLKKDKLIAFEYRPTFKQKSQASERLQQLAAQLVLDCPPPADPGLWTAPVTESKPLAERPTQAPQDNWWQRWLNKTVLSALPGLIFIAITAVPAFFGAVNGYTTGEFSGDAQKGAMQGAAMATMFSTTIALIVASLMVVTATSLMPTGTGIMPAWMGGIFIGFMMLVVGAIVVAVITTCAAIGAYVGAGFSARLAGWLAAIGTLFATLSGLLLQNMPK